MKKSILLYLSLCFTAFNLFAQEKQALNFDVYDGWKSVQSVKISKNGQWSVYAINPQEGDGQLAIHPLKKGETQWVERGYKAQIDPTDAYVVFQIEPHLDTLRAQRRRKVKKDDLPKDSLGIYSLKDGQMLKIPDVRSFKVPEKNGGFLAYWLEPQKEEKDTASVKEENTEAPEEEMTKDAPKSKKESKKNGSKLIFRNLETGAQDTFLYVTDYAFDPQGKHLAFVSTGTADSSFEAGVYAYLVADGILETVKRDKGKVKSLTWDEQGDNLAFLADLDSSEARIRNYGLYRWQGNKTEAELLADSTSGLLNDKGWIVSEHQPLKFSKDQGLLYFGVAPKPLLADTTLLEEEIVSVDIWNWQDGRLQPQQAVELDDDLKRSFTTVANITSGRLTQLGQDEIPTVRLSETANTPLALGISGIPYEKYRSWEGYPAQIDLYSIDISSGEAKLLQKGLRANANISTGGKYFYWYSATDTAWFAQPVSGSTQAINLTGQLPVSFADELNDRPDYPYSYGMAGWTKDDRHLLLYDRFDVWQIDPASPSMAKKLTNGRQASDRYRMIDLDDDNEYIDPAQKQLLSIFNEKTRQEGYAWIDLAKGKAPEEMVRLDKSLSGVVKAKEADVLIYRQSDYQNYADLYLTNSKFKKSEKLTTANPQQQNYLWGTVELVSWVSSEGEELEGLLYKPENFDPNKKYPMITYFYERVSDRLHSYGAPTPSPSTIRPSMYNSNGYVVFMPDIPYKIGYPGESAESAIVPGVASILAKGFVHKDRLGIQGQSWGGYQVAHLVTRTNMFAAAMAGAPVSNMTSAYGGIRWGSGLSRMFQYERTQSRIGGTLWEQPLRYIENSPLFHADRIKTPLLIMHNDNDGAVPWYQGIEFFTALRRLEKPVWMLTYNGEVHNLMQRQNRKDLSRRMMQFFDHYLKDAPAPLWMAKGVPAVEKKINMGFELMEE